MSDLLSVAVLGSTGYVGLQLVDLLSKHPKIKINFLGSENFVNKKISDIDKQIQKTDLPIINFNKNFEPKGFDLVFLCLPHGISHEYVKKLFNKITIIDLSADFRLDSENIYEENYNTKHSCANLLKNFTYSLPEENKELIKKSSNLSIPGCYPTSILTPLIPLLKNNLVKSDDIIIDSKSGYSGAGKKFDLKKIIKNNQYNFYNYNTNDHRHQCEIKQELKKHSKKDVNFSFNPHLLPIFRGMMSTIYLNLEERIDINYVENFLIKYADANQFINYIKNKDRLDFFNIQNTNNCNIRIFKHYNDSKIILVSLIDNLLKGAAGQAIQSMNIMYNFEENSGLIF